jgi:hypothetical protein
MQIIGCVSPRFSWLLLGLVIMLCVIFKGGFVKLYVTVEQHAAVEIGGQEVSCHILF